MTERERQRRLHVENRLEELRSKYGRGMEDEPLPEYLDTLQGALQARIPQAAPPQSAATPTVAVSAPVQRNGDLSLADLDV